MNSKVKSWWRPPALRIGEENNSERHATWLELFYDLVFVAVIAKLAHDLNQDFSAYGFFRFLVLFTSIWWSWVSSTLYSTRFDTDDPLHRFLTGIQMFFLTILATNVHNGLGENSASFAFAYALVRTVNVIEYQRVLRHVSVVRKLTSVLVRNFGIIGAIWLVSTLVPIPLRWLLWLVALILDFVTPLSIGKLSIQFAPNHFHLPERFGLFIIIVLGESIIGVINGFVQQPQSILSILSLGFGISIAFSIWWIYFDNLGGSAIESARACSCRVWAYQLWLYMHLPLAISLTVTGVGIEKIISRVPELVLPSSERFLICMAVAVCLLALGIINLTGLIASQQQKHGQFRIGYRFGAATLITIVAIFGAFLSPIQLIGSIAIICAVQIILELRNPVSY